MKFLMFSDFHYIPGYLYDANLDTLRMFFRRAKEEGCDFILHAGDLCHGPSTVPELMELLKTSPVPVYHCLGNHDTDLTPYEETLALYHMPDGHYFFDTCGYRIIVLDANYCKVDGEYIHYSMGNYYKWPEYRDHTPPEQLRWLEETIAGSPWPCILVGHDSYEREADGAKDLREVQRIIRRANEERPHKVLMAMNGHYHRDNLRILDNVLYWDVNSVNYDWIGKPEHHDLFPKELYEKFSRMKNIVCYRDPLHAIVTVEGNTITIEGTESEMLCGIGRAEVGANLFDESGRPTVPHIQSARITLL